MLFGYQAVYDRGFHDAIDYAARNGFDYVSFDLNVPTFYIDALDDDAVGGIRQHAEEQGIGLAFHAPGDNISLFSDYLSIRKGILEHLSAIIAAAEKLNARHVTIHPGSYPSLKQAGKTEDDFAKEYRDYFSRTLCENLMHLAGSAGNVLLCVENVNFTPLTMNVVEQTLADCDRLYLTWDIAKTYDRQLQLSSEVHAFLTKHTDRIREVHVHDIIRGFRSHQIVGDGGIDFRDYASVLRLPDVAVTIEVRPREAATASRDNLLSLLRSD
jgi:sugar phosphate isomerase/epimerase